MEKPKNLRRFYWETIENQDPFFRQSFIDSIDLRESSKYVNKVNYSELPKDSRIMVTLGYAGKKAEIIIYPSAFSFEKHPYFDDFKGSIFHECFHAKEYHDNDPRLCPVKKFPTIEDRIKNFKTELRAYEYQIKNFNEKNSYIYVNWVVNEKEQIKSAIEELLESELNLDEYRNFFKKYKKENNFVNC